MNNYYGPGEGQQRAMQQQVNFKNKIRHKINAGFRRVFKFNWLGLITPMNHFQTGRIPQGHAQHQSARGQGAVSHHQPAPSYPTRYRALYDYDAQDVDEVSFLESDLIVESTPVIMHIFSCIFIYCHFGMVFTKYQVNKPYIMTFSYIYQIEEGWLTGTVQRTGKRGMLPANYVSAM